MKDQLRQFHSDEFGVFEILVLNDKPYFPATDCAKMLGYVKPESAVARNCKGSLKRRVPTNGGDQSKAFIPEGDLYRLIIRSKLPAAERFEAFVFDEILPTIRKVGAYILPDLLDEMTKNTDYAAALLRELQEEQQKSALYQKRSLQLMPKALYADLVLQSSNSVAVSVIAKDYGMTSITFNQLLHELSIQYRVGSTWVLYQKYADKSYTETRTCVKDDRIAWVHTRWTQKGRHFLYQFLKSKGYAPICETQTNKDQPAQVSMASREQIL